jgi:hypothetical protein
MGKVLPRAAMGAISLVGLAITSSPFNSNAYPYTIQQPAGFTHIVLLSVTNQRVDYFAPALYSSITDVTISAIQGRPILGAMPYLRTVNGKNVHQSGWLTIMGHRYKLICADFSGFPGKWREEQVTLQSHGWFWRLTASYELRYAKLRGTMLSMLQSFKVHAPLSRHKG